MNLWQRLFGGKGCVPERKKIDGSPKASSRSTTNTQNIIQAKSPGKEEGKEELKTHANQPKPTAPKQSNYIEAKFPMTADQAKKVQQNCAKALGVPLTIDLDCGNGISLRLIFIPPGKFIMGSPYTEAGRDDDESPQHEVHITRPFYMGVYPITSKQYKEVTGKMGGCYGEDDPAGEIAWDNINEFCVKMTERTGRSVFLPTEAQWEYACRAGSTTRFSFGDDDDSLPLYGWFNDNITHPVGMKRPNPWGLYDMHGGIWEWCADWYGPYSNQSSKDPQGPTSGKFKVLRGGEFAVLYPEYCRSANRSWCAPNHLSDGFRVAVRLK